MHIKKHSTKNEYINAGGVWVRNFTKPKVPSVSLSHMFEKEDYPLILAHQTKNMSLPKISDEKIRFENIVIVSDGYKFDDIHPIIQELPKNVAVLAVNGALRHWTLMSRDIPQEERRSINGYVINNPYPESMRYLPRKESQYFPTCIASSRTSHDFTSKYQGDVYLYEPSLEKSFGLSRKEAYHIDDYRNPVCAAVGLAHQFKVKKLMLLCCDDSFETQRDFALQLDNGLWTFPHHKRSHDIIDANLYWLTHQDNVEIEVADFSSGPKYLNATYISNVKDAVSFFVSQEEGE